MDDASRQRFNEQVTSAFQTSAMDRFADDRYKQNDGGRLSDVLERLGCGYVADAMDDLTAFYHIPAVKFAFRVVVDVRRPLPALPPNPPLQPAQPNPATPCLATSCP